jgi:hypothetical protein
MGEFALRNFYVAILFVINDFEYVFVDSIQDIVIGRSLMATRNFLMMSEGKERSLAREWCIKRKRKCGKNI